MAETDRKEGETMSETAHTMPMKVANTGFMLDRMGQDCAPLQFLRELTQNAVQAIQATPEEEGEIVWDADPGHLQMEGRYKLACIDTGIGMTGPEMVEYINALSSSIYQQAHDANFGVGAKVAAATRNHEGLLYLSWKDGVGSMVHLWRDPETGQYGLKQFQRDDGTFSHHVRVDDMVKPDQIKDHGTMVILMGNMVDADTMRAPEGAPTPSAWIVRYLNTRYFRFPEGITVKARELRGDGLHNILSRVTGQEIYLTEHSETAGTVELTGAKAHWWILKAEPALGQRSGYYASSGHMAALYQDELYELATSSTGVSRLQSFGVTFGWNRVVIYVEPENSSERTLTSNTARTQLLLDGESLPWVDWGDEFREKMPQEIRDLMEEVVAGSTSKNHRQAIAERLKQIQDLFKISRYKRSPKGTASIEVTAPGGGLGETEPKGTDDNPKGGGKGGRRGKGGQEGNIYSWFISEDGEPGKEIQGNSYPEVTWVTAEDGTRTPPELEDRAAKYLERDNKIFANGDFRVFTDMIDRWDSSYPNVQRSFIQDTVRDWFEQALVETVLGVQALQGSQLWTVEEIEKALSEEALTSAVMQRYHIDNSIKRALGKRLGSLKEQAS